MTTYEYDAPTEPVLWRKDPNPTPPPDEIDVGIQPDILASDMANKSVAWCSWNQEEELLAVVFETPLGAEDKAKLDVIVENNMGT